MSTDTELQARAAALSREIAAAGVSLCEAAKDAPARAQPLLHRGEALTAEHTRRARAGVRVMLNADDFDSRRLTFYADLVAHLQRTNTASSAAAASVVPLLSRAMSLLSEMGDALLAPQHAAAVRAEAEAAAEDAAAKAAAAAKQRPIDERNARFNELARLVVLGAKKHQADVAAGRTTADVWLP